VNELGHDGKSRKYNNGLLKGTDFGAVIIGSFCSSVVLPLTIRQQRIAERNGFFSGFFIGSFPSSVVLPSYPHLSAQQFGEKVVAGGGEGAILSVVFDIKI
jgi:hypothetical protein